MAIERYGILNDIHYPYEDKQRYALAVQILKDSNIDRLYLNGDISEFQGVSSWPTHPSEKGMGFCAELDYTNKKFDELMVEFDGLPTSFIVGNHEDRFFRYVRDLAPAMWGILDCPALLKFPERPRWKFVPYGPNQLERCGASNLYLRHEPLGGGASHAKQTAESSYVDVAYGHTHTFQSYSHKKFGPKPYIVRSYSLGWLGDKSRHVFDYRGSKDNWVHGLTIVEACTKTGEYELNFVDLRSVPVMFRGKKYDFKAEKRRPK